MRQASRLFGCGSILLAFLVLIGIWLWQGQRAFSPGPLSTQQVRGRTLGGVSHHADLEDRCQACHRPPQPQADLCTQCHEDIRAEWQSQGLHARVQEPNHCRRCHPDHRGRHFDMLEPARQVLDHDRATDFALTKHFIDFDLRPLSCEACHPTWPVDAVEPIEQRCHDCHQRGQPDFMARHVQEFPGSCLTCHNGTDRMTDFDHARTAFPLRGKHQWAGCAQCHPGGRFTETPTTCRGCHDEPEVHRGLFPETCDRCHTEQGWRPARWQDQSFDHEALRFRLVRHRRDPKTGQVIACTACHENSRGFAFLAASCETCHSQRDPAFMQAHKARYGPPCLECHDGADRMADFDHAQVFPLEGAHSSLVCTACHQNFRFPGTPRECASCHEEPALHQGLFGRQCHYCHTAQGWAPAFLRVHNFPLNHGAPGPSACNLCHPNNRYTDYTCYGCHAHTPEEVRNQHQGVEVSADEFPRCASCHPHGRRSE